MISDFLSSSSLLANRNSDICLESHHWQGSHLLITGSHCQCHQPSRITETRYRWVTCVNKHGECVLGTNTEVFLWLPHTYTLKECMCTQRHKYIHVHVRRVTDTHRHSMGWGWGERGRQDREWRIIKNEFNFCGLVCLKVFWFLILQDRASDPFWSSMRALHV